jgi:hypothetical protein
VKLRRRALDSWIGQIQAGWGDRAACTARALSPTISQWNPQPNWHEFGAQLAGYGHPLDDAVEWLRLLGAAIPRRIGKSAMHPTSLTALASGWAAGQLLVRMPICDVVNLDVLRLRMRQHFQQATALGIAADQYAALVVVDLGMHHSEISTATIARHAHSVFSTGETLASNANGKLLVFAPRDQALAERVRHLAHVILDDRSLANAPVRVSIEPIGATVDLLDAHLQDLAS